MVVCVLKETVERQRSNWLAARMLSLRKRVKEYRRAWIQHRTEKTISAELSELIRVGAKPSEIAMPLQFRAPSRSWIYST